MDRVYATPEQLAHWAGHAAPPDAELLLAGASADIDTALLTASYATSLSGYPIDPHVRTALADAVCAQVEHWLAAGSDGVGTPDGPVGLSGGGSASTALATMHGAELAPRACRALHDAGLLPGEVRFAEGPSW